MQQGSGDLCGRVFVADRRRSAASLSGSSHLLNRRFELSTRRAQLTTLETALSWARGAHRSPKCFFNNSPLFIYCVPPYPLMSILINPSLVMSTPIFTTKFYLLYSSSPPFSFSISCLSNDCPMTISLTRFAISCSYRFILSSLYLSACRSIYLPTT
jgi:hypothetical protein